jgi:hypothetical protein
MSRVNAQIDAQGSRLALAMTETRLSPNTVRSF